MIPSPIHFSHGTNGPPKLFLQCSAPQLFVLFYSLQFLEKTFNRHYIVQKQCISMLNKSNIPSTHNLFQAFGQWIVLRSQRKGKNKKEERERGETHPPTLSHPLTVFFFFSAHISLHHPHDSNIAFPPPPPLGGSRIQQKPGYVNWYLMNRIWFTLCTWFLSLFSLYRVLTKVYFLDQQHRDCIL